MRTADRDGERGAAHGMEAASMLGAIAIRVLASGSSGNCTLLAHGAAGGRRLALVDLGISPRRLRTALADHGLSMHDIEDVFLTHLDTDHLHPGWRQVLPGSVRLRAHDRHAAGLRGMGFRASQVAGFTEECDAAGGMRCACLLCDHDEAGVSVFRFESAGSLGFATDVGRVTEELIERLAGVEALAIESNYCPRLQKASSRPEFLKRRIMGGFGHLSNGECERAVRAINPRRHVVLLHLSRECNNPELAAAPHRERWYELTISSQDRPTRWIVSDGTAPARTAIHAPIATTLFGARTERAVSGS